MVFRGVLIRVWQVLVGQINWLSHRRIPLRIRGRFTLSCVCDLPRGRGVHFFGATFRSDNNLGLLLLPTYVKEIENIRRCISADRGSVDGIRILDVGANVGQFAVTAINLLGATVVSFEPNPDLRTQLEHNALTYKASWTIIYRAVSSQSAPQNPHFVTGKSAQGSFEQANAQANLLRQNLVKTVIVDAGPVTEEILQSHSCPGGQFDLVKLDAEGHELEALAGLSDIDFSYVHVEIAPHRSNGFTEATFARELARVTKGRPRLLWSYESLVESTSYNALFKIEV